MRNDSTAVQAPVNAPDYRLILASLEKKAMAGEDLERTRRILASPRIWNALPVAQRLQWASLAQVCGAVDTALTVLESVNRLEPGNPQAWRDRITLLLILDRRDEAARLMALARQQAGEVAVTGLAVPPPPSEVDHAGEESNAFDRLRRRERQIARYLSLFSGRQDAFARQWADRDKGTQGYVPVRRPLAGHDVEDHLKGRATYGIYLLKADSTTRIGVIDADLVAGLRQGRQTAEVRRQVLRERSFMLSRIKALSTQNGLDPLVEFSGGKGFHFWYFFQQPLAAARVRALLDTIAGQVAPDLATFTLETFPKQDRLSGKGFGNLVKLPLGIHRVTGKPSMFIHCANRQIDAQLDFLSGVKPAPPDVLTETEQPAMVKVVAHPRWQQWTESYPELSALCNHCPPMDQIITLCREGNPPALREERILFQTVGLLGRAKTLLHHLYSFSTAYNPHWVDYKLSRVRGTPLGCRRIHTLLNFTGDLCTFSRAADYPHPLLHLDEGFENSDMAPSEKVASLKDALDHLQSAMDRVRHFMK